MGSVSVGSNIQLRCDVKPGPFEHERMVSFEAIDGHVSGFVKTSELSQIGAYRYVRCVVEAVFEDDVTVRCRGDFFTSNGRATVSSALILTT
jgi:hypothetical protein